MHRFLDKNADPDYQTVVGMLELISMKIKYSECVVSFSHSDYRTAIGGTEKVLQEEQALLDAKQISYIQVFPVNIGLKWVEPEHQLLGLNIDSEFAGRFTATQLGRILSMVGKSGLSIIQIHLHHLLGIGIMPYQYITRELETDVYLYLHDYYTACPQINFLKNNEKFCGAPPIGNSICNSCEFGEVRLPHVGELQTFIAHKVTHIIAPSEVARDLWAQVFPEFLDKIQVIPHLIFEPDVSKNSSYRKSDRKLRVAFVGYQQSNKGWNTWRKLASFVDINHFELFHLGASHTELPNVTQIPVSFVDNGSDAMKQALDKYEIDVAFLWSTWPETFSFTLYESIASGCFVVTNSNSGNIAAQVRNFGSGEVLSGEEELFRFFSNPKDLKDKVYMYINQAEHFNFKFNPKIVTLVASRINRMVEKSRVSWNDVLKQDEDLIDNLIQGMTISRQLEQVVEQSVKQKEFIDYLQIMHGKKDGAIEDLRGQLLKITLSSVVREKLREKVLKYPRFKKILKKIITK